MKFNNHDQAVEPEETIARWQRHMGLMAKDHTIFGLDDFDRHEFRKNKVLDNTWSKIKVKSKLRIFLLFTLISSRCYYLIAVVRT